MKPKKKLAKQTTLLEHVTDINDRSAEKAGFPLPPLHCGHCPWRLSQPIKSRIIGFTRAVKCLLPFVRFICHLLNLSPGISRVHERTRDIQQTVIPFHLNSSVLVIFTRENGQILNRHSENLNIDSGFPASYYLVGCNNSFEKWRSEMLTGQIVY